jgi:hypothetical protein
MQPVSEQQLGKHAPTATDTNAAIKKRCFLRGPCREVITRTVGAMSSIELCKRGKEEMAIQLGGINGIFAGQ